MKTLKKAIRTLSAMVICLSGLGGILLYSPVSAADDTDILYIGDGGDDSIKKFDSKTGVYLGDLVPPGGSGLLGPRGLIRKGSALLVVNQNVNHPIFNGEVLRFNRSTGEFSGALVPCQADLGRTCDPNAPFTPRGMIKGPDAKLFVADQFGASFFFDTEGSLKEYDSRTGQFVRNLDTTNFPDSFHPRGVVMGPDGKLYVSARQQDGVPGYVLRFNPETGAFINVFASFQPTATDCSKHLHRPEGLVFGPDGNLYVTSFQADANDTDKILVFSKRGKCLDQIDLDQVGEHRAFAQAIIFGPKGRLFVPINNQAALPDGNPFTGEVRRYNVKTKNFDIFVPSVANGGSLKNPWYLSFGGSNSKTLKYK
jgi:DNA-binding beta-propeller fold protein YncE